MVTVNYYSHLPMIRIAEESHALGPGSLWRFPFDAWNAQTAGAFAEHREAYERTAPVFFFMEIEADSPILVPGPPEEDDRIELKRPTRELDEDFERMGFGFLTHFLETFGWTTQAAVTLAAPAAAPGSPRSSMTLCTPDDAHFEIGGNSARLARIQGDADHEWLLLPEACGPPLPAETLDFASALWDFAASARENRDLARAIDSLLLCAEPTLSPRDQLVLATISLEALLLPEVRTGLTATFIRRVAALLSGSQDTASVERSARVLYDARSAALHGSEPKDQQAASALMRCCAAQQLLAASILSLGPSLLAGVQLADLREELEKGRAPTGAIAALPLDFAAPAGMRAENRLEHPRPTSAPYSLVAGGVMHAEEGAVASWSPALGLACDETLEVKAGRFAVVPLDAVELVELDERDIKRDFVHELRSDDVLETFPLEQIACIGLFDHGRHNLQDLKRRRELAITTLRLAGLSEFIDPALLGWYVYEGARKYRTPTVLRQSILFTMVHPPPQRISQADAGRIEELAALLATYDTDHAHEQIDELIGEFLRAHPTRFLPGQASAGLLLAILEEVLGRFRPRRAAIQLEDLVATIVGPRESEWFGKRGRPFRMSVAHGRWEALNDSENELKTMLTIVRQIVEALIRFRVELDHRSIAPVQAFLKHVEAQVGR